MLQALTVAPRGSMRGYEREKFPHWTQDDGCDTRERVLQRAGSHVRINEDCEVVSGVWVSPYDGQRWTRDEALDIDHVVPLAAAWRSGADDWSQTRREAFANDLIRPELRAVTDDVNRAKSDQPPGEWKPPLRSRWCAYATAWIVVKHHWSLTITTEEKTALSRMLEHC